MHALLKPTVIDFNQDNSCNNHSGSGYLQKPKLNDDIKRKILNSHRESFDWKHGGIKSPIKFLDRDSIEYSLVKAGQGDQVERAMACITLNNALSLIDPVWGGMYQYSTKEWDSPHHKKTMANQAGCLRLYALAYGLLGNKNYLDAAFRIRDYLQSFLLSESGGFYSEQSDYIEGIEPFAYFKLSDTQRRSHGIPCINKHRYARENGWAIEALCTLYEFSGDNLSLDLAINAANWITKHRLLPDGGFKHDKFHTTAPCLSDTLAMGRAMLQLFKVTQQEKWLIRSINAADFISIHFKQRGGGFCSHIETLNSTAAATQIDENISLMRYSNLLTHYSEMRRHRGMAKHCLRYLCRESIATARNDEVGLLLADMEFSQKPIQILIFGNRFQKRTQSLLKTGLKFPLWYKYIGQFLHRQSRYTNQQMSLNSNVVAYVEHGDYKSHEIYHPSQLKELLSKLM